MAEEIAPCWAGIICLFSVVFIQLPACKFQWGKRCRYRVFLEYKLKKLERGQGPNKTSYRNILFEAVLGKVFCTNALTPRWRKTILFLFRKAFSFKFWVLGSFKVLTLLWSSLWTWSAKQFQISPTVNTLGSKEKKKLKFWFIWPLRLRSGYVAVKLWSERSENKTWDFAVLLCHISALSILKSSNLTFSRFQ